MYRSKSLIGSTALAVAAVFLVGSVSELAHAEDGDERKSPLEGQPAVRKRKLLVKKRFEVTPLFESSVNADFKHTLSFGLKAEYHLSDMFSIGGLGAYGIPLNTGLTSRIVDTLPATGTPGDPTPSQTEFEEHLNEMPLHAAVYASITPWYGKLAAFGAFFVNFDFYFQGGLAIASLKNDCCSFPTDSMPGGDEEAGIPSDGNPNNDPALNDGIEPGLYLGGGIHIFVSDAVALDFTVRNYMFKDNPSGLDFNADQAVKEEDSRFLNHLFLGLGVSIFLPTKVKRTP
jgi:outer membrane beta-barrel protein